MYFDRIERKDVVILLDSIYEHVKSLEDIQFLVQYAPLVLPQEPSDANGDRIWHNILDLQDDLIQKREASVVTLGNALNQLYPEQKPETVSEKLCFEIEITEIYRHDFLSCSKLQEKLRFSFKRNDLQQKRNC